MFCYFIIAILKVVVTIKLRIVKYILYKLDEMISADEAYIRFEYFVIYLNWVIQNII